ncbi:Uncharacterized conserved protein [Campylobacter sputorum subsp. bubulus]|uniref:Uncharacterized conserved protein n=1 Tax=Campylobacter sputorum subsp. sputorum TaxID=32024 RepID=A0A381DL36_9BACT|nr:hypothetical protein [Campylobacter sputorum]ASM34746.1 hypothetical protein CSPUT_0495 [Campylobacter sputorum aubsp. sputorum RM3237]KAB0581697.1 hypothetical protein F7P64_05410 [Campylobacter sputorum subsp. sputorum]QEL04937.1 hypothetical protein CSPT_0495 [Campylobacter sputorum subsp. sputorum]SUX10028.1 Uncharacterized conserved protein [Campylobacter sputorum subsp. bubulus]SUX11423.1 Uncharacterized conserved protein [Campylobacter sputorum subsp. sputorum]
MLKDILYIGLGGFLATKDKIQKELDALEQKGKLSKEDSKAFLKSLYEKGEDEHERHMQILKDILKDIIKDLNLATKDDIEKLEKKIDDKIL